MNIETSRTPSMEELLEAATHEALSDVFSCLPGKIELYDPAQQKANVKPLIKRRYLGEDGDEGIDELPVITDVPVLFPRGGGYFLSFPVKKGDNVTLLFVDRSIDDYVGSDGATDTAPLDFRQFDISDAVAIPAWSTFLNSIKDVVASGAVFGKEGGPQVRVNDTAVEVTSNGAPVALDFVAMALKVEAQLEEIRILLKTWVVAPTDGGAALKAAALALWAAPSTSVGSANLKAD